MMKTAACNDPPVIVRMTAMSVARNVGRAALVVAASYALAQHAAALAEANCKQPGRIRALYLNGPSDPFHVPGTVL